MSSLRRGIDKRFADAWRRAGAERGASNCALSISAIEHNSNGLPHDVTTVSAKRSRILTLAATVPMLIPAGIIATIVWLSFASTTIAPVGDEWEMVDILRAKEAGTLSVGDLLAFRENTEHRTAASRAITLALILLTGWDRHAHILFNLVLTGVTAALLIAAGYCTVRSRFITMAIATPILVLIFSLARFANWFLPYTDKIPTVFGIAICMFGLTVPKSRNVQLILALAGAIVASLSSSGGLLAWIVFAPAVFVTSGTSFAIWIATSIAVIVPYLSGIHSGSLSIAQSREGSLFLDPVSAVTYTLTYLGAPIGYPNVEASQLFGALGLCAVTANIILLGLKGPKTSRFRQALAAWAGAAGFAVASALAVMLGRAVAFGFDEAITSRFIGFSSFLWIALLVVASVIFTLPRAPERAQATWLPRLDDGVRFINVLVMLAAGIGILQANSIAFQHASGYLETLQSNQDCIVAFRTAPDKCLEMYRKYGDYGDSTQFRDDTAYIADRRLALFRNVAHIEALLPRPEFAQSSNRFRCDRVGSGTKRDPKGALPAGMGSQAIANACTFVEQEDDSNNSLQTSTPHGFNGTCAVDSWQVYGERWNADGRQWCMVEWFLDQNLAGVSLVSMDGTTAIHADKDGSVDIAVKDGRDA